MNSVAELKSIVKSRFDDKKISEIKSNLAQCIGTEGWHRVRKGDNSFLFTDGVKMMAEMCEAYWLITYIYSYQTALPKHIHDDMQVWEVVVYENNHAKITLSGGNLKKIFAEEIPFTDFPLRDIKLWVEQTGDMDGNLTNVLLLPSEH